MMGIGENPLLLQTHKERAEWVFENCRDAGYSATDKEKPGDIVFPYDPEWATLDKLAGKDYESKGKFILLSLDVRSELFGDQPLHKDIVRMCLSGSTHLTIARYAAQELMQYLQQGFGNVTFTPADLLFLQNHHENGMTWLLDTKYACFTVIDGGQMKLHPGKATVLYGHSQTFSNAALVSPEQMGFTGRNDQRLKKTLDEHLENLQRGANALKGFYDDFTFRVE